MRTLKDYGRSWSTERGEEVLAKDTGEVGAKKREKKNNAAKQVD